MHELGTLGGAHKIVQQYNGHIKLLPSTALLSPKFKWCGEGDVGTRKLYTHRAKHTVNTRYRNKGLLIFHYRIFFPFVFPTFNQMDPVKPKLFARLFLCISKGLNCNVAFLYLWKIHIQQDRTHSG